LALSSLPVSRQALTSVSSLFHRQWVGNHLVRRPASITEGAALTTILQADDQLTVEQQSSRGTAEALSYWFQDRVKCPICSSDDFKVIYDAPYEEPPLADYLVAFYSPQGAVEPQYLKGARYTLCECESCQAIFQKSIPNDFLMERLYEHWIDPARIMRVRREENRFELCCNAAQEVMQIVSFIGKNPSTLSFLDYGMGWGDWALMAKAFGCESYGTELSATRIEHARKNGIGILSFAELSSHRFDFINTEQVFEHLPDPLETLLHLKQALKPDGIIKISVPGSSDIARRLAAMDWAADRGAPNCLNAVAPLEHINCFRRKSNLKMASAAGMREVRVPMRTQYAYETDWSDPRKIAANLIRPFYRNVLRKPNYIFLRRDD
jgi:2-polyprenyl-3-methyl-5-hydroxy-6-metoxy-1,4-benzoquinol methylase